jgi:hypothetical protein
MEAFRPASSLCKELMYRLIVADAENTKGESDHDPLLPKLFAYFDLIVLRVRLILHISSESWQSNSGCIHIVIIALILGRLQLRLQFCFGYVDPLGRGHGSIATTTTTYLFRMKEMAPEMEVTKQIYCPKCDARFFDF